MHANRHLPTISHKGAGALDVTLSVGAADADDAAQRAGEAWLADYNPAAASLDKMSEIRSLSENDLALLRCAPISEQFPIEFANGSGWKEIEGQCACCNQKIDAQHMFGQITRPTAKVFVMDAMGVCLDCHVATPFHYRFHDDMRISGLFNGAWRTWQAKKSIGQRLKQLFTRG